MNLAEMAQFGPYVWGAYGLFALALLIEIISLRIARRQIGAQLRQSRALTELMRREHRPDVTPGNIT